MFCDQASGSPAMTVTGSGGGEIHGLADRCLRVEAAGQGDRPGRVDAATALRQPVVRFAALVGHRERGVLQDALEVLAESRLRRMNSASSPIRRLFASIASATTPVATAVAMLVPLRRR